VNRIALAGFWAIARACVICAAAGFVLSIALVAFGIGCADDALIAGHLRAALQDGTLVGADSTSPFGHRQLHYDMTTECMALGMNLASGGQSFARRIAAAPTITAPHGGGEEACSVLFRELRAGRMTSNVDYARYWHGYQAISRPLLSVMPLGIYRRVIATLFFTACIILGACLARLFGVWAWPATFLPFFLVSDLYTASFLTTHGLPLAVGFLSIALAALLLERAPGARDWRLPALAFASGMAVNFIGYLINPPLVPAFIAFLAIAYRAGRGVRATLENLVYAGALIALWYAGYFTEWIGKWLFASLVLGPGEGVLSVIARAHDYHNEEYAVTVQFLQATQASYYQIGGRAMAVFVGAICGAVALLAALRKLAPRLAFDFFAMLAPLASIVLWIEATPRVSFIHREFVSRSFILIPVAAMLAVLLVLRLDTQARAAARPS
jgi:hypothetical protein